MPEDEKKPTNIGAENEVPVRHFSNRSSLEADEPDSVEPVSTEYVSHNDVRAERTPEVVVAEQPAAHVPITQPAQATTPEVKASSPNTPGVLILQWLTYAFWGWTLVALYWLTGLSVQYFVQNSSAADDYSLTYLNNMLAYSLAAVIVLFIISIICDIVYSKFEPRRKSGAAMVIMIIHAVIFALCGIGSLIAAVFAVVNMLISGGNEGATTTLITAGVMTLLYAATLIRTLHPEKIKHVTQLFWVAMLVATLVIASLGVFGPVAYAQRTKNDRAIESALPSIASGINDYTNEHGKLPSSLKDSKLQQSYAMGFDEQAKRLINDELVRYSAKEKLTSSATQNLSNSLGLGKAEADAAAAATQADMRKNDAVYHYQLCVNYDAEKSDRYGYDTRSGGSYDQKYETSPETSSHPAGEVCYDLQTDYIYDY